MRPRELIINALILEGCDEKAADVVLAAVRQWLAFRVEELRADRKPGDAVWYDKFRRELE